MKGALSELEKKNRIIKGFAPLPVELDAHAQLRNCGDFLRQRTGLQDLFESRGHILLMGVKYHCEFAGLGIEYCWGKTKLEYRRLPTAQTPKSLHQNILDIFKKHLPRERVMRFSRRARDYERFVASLSLLRTSPVSLSYPCKS